MITSKPSRITPNALLFRNDETAEAVVVSLSKLYSRKAISQLNKEIGQRGFFKPEGRWGGYGMNIIPR